ncbi:MAG: polymer-forming cytoskeletal protein [Pseudomonadota bacterium]
MADVTTVIGDTIRLQGNLQGDEDLQVYGRIDGTIQLSKTLIVESSGVIKADVSVQNAVISGVVVGNITASDAVEITREGRMVGDIVAPRVILVDGASFKGQVDMGNLELPRPQGMSMPRARPAASPAKTATSARPAPAKVATPARPTRVEAKVVEPEPEPVKPAAEPPRSEPARMTQSSPGKKATVVAPKPQLMHSKKRRVAVKKR